MSRNRDGSPTALDIVDSATAQIVQYGFEGDNEEWEPYTSREKLVDKMMQPFVDTKAESYRQLLDDYSQNVRWLAEMAFVHAEARLDAVGMEHPHPAESALHVGQFVVQIEAVERLLSYARHLAGTKPIDLAPLAVNHCLRQGESVNRVFVRDFSRNNIAVVEGTPTERPATDMMTEIITAEMPFWIAAEQRDIFALPGHNEL